MLEDDDVQIEDAALNGSSEAHHQTYNFAPGSTGVVCRADASPSGVEVKGKCHFASDNKSSREEASSLEGRDEVIKYSLQSMKWGVLPSWSKQNDAPSRGVINCRDDSLRNTGGMWQSIKARKRCVVVAQGFFEWLNTPEIELILMQ
jgi:putative SOS response-associated peptidase YedK